MKKILFAVVLCMTACSNQEQLDPQLFQDQCGYEMPSHGTTLQHITEGPMVVAAQPFADQGTIWVPAQKEASLMTTIYRCDDFT